MINKSMGLKVLIMPLSLVTVAFLAILLIQPEFKNMRSAAALVKTNNERLFQLQQQSENLATLRKSFDSMGEVKIVKSALPESPATDIYVAEIYQKAVVSGVVIDTLSAPASQDNLLMVNPICSDNPPPSSNEVSTVAATANSAPASSAPVAPDAAGANLVNRTDCIKNVDMEIDVKGTWDQIVSFLKLLNGSNRITDISAVKLLPLTEGVPEGQQASDLIKATISVNAYMKAKSFSTDMSALDALAKGAGFDPKVLGRIKSVVGVPYEAPQVSDTAERNIFK